MVRTRKSQKLEISGNLEKSKIFQSNSKNFLCPKNLQSRFFGIIKKQKIAENTFLMQILAPEIAKKAKAGHFVILRIDENGERIPLTIADNDRKSITVVFLVAGKTTEQLSNLKKNDYLLDLVGPLGNESEIREYGNVCLIGGGLGIAPLYPIAKAMKKAKNSLIIIIGAKNRKFLFWEERFKKIADALIICTDDGSKGKKGFVSEALISLMAKKKLNRIISIGPLVMMKAISDLTKGRVKTIASLNPVMVDGLGMCGSCRVVIGGETKFCCVDGPEFDAHLVDWEEIMSRNKLYLEEEKCAECGKRK